jgi:hypothetical protein
MSGCPSRVPGRAKWFVEKSIPESARLIDWASGPFSISAACPPRSATIMLSSNASGKEDAISIASSTFAARSRMVRSSAQNRNPLFDGRGRSGRGFPALIDTHRPFSLIPSYRPKMNTPNPVCP